MSKKREVQEINASSMADIAFLLLIFFLVTTTMDTDMGIMRVLPPPINEEDPDPPIVREKNVYVVLVNANDQLLVEGEPMRIENLKAGAMEFLTNSGVFTDNYNDPDLPERLWVRRSESVENLNAARAMLSNDPNNHQAQNAIKRWEESLMAIDLLGEYKALPSSALISLQNDNGTSYNMYIQVQNELQSAVNQLRDDLSVERFGVPFNQLDLVRDQEKILAIRQVFPQRISEAEPKNTVR